MLVQTKLALVAVAAVATLAAAGVLCPLPLCEGAVRAPNTQPVTGQLQAPDTATLRLHISGMTCGSCAFTARTALKQLAGVFSATVTLDDSLGIVRYDPRKVTPTQIAAHLTRLTGYGVSVLADDGRARGGRGSDQF
jgi:copper chaperone CopZ